MEIIGIDERDGTIFTKISREEFANMAGFAYYSTMKDKLEVKVGMHIKVGSIFTDARTALEIHETALKAAKQLKATSSRFLGFFKTKEDNK